jgi:hypothetical protein
MFDHEKLNCNVAGFSRSCQLEASLKGGLLRDLKSVYQRLRFVSGNTRALIDSTLDQLDHLSDICLL